MNDQQINALIDRIVKRVKDELIGNKLNNFPPADAKKSKNAYVVLPEKINAIELCTIKKCLREFKRAYSIILVISQKGCFIDEVIGEVIGEADYVLDRDNIELIGDYVIVVPVATRNLIVKTALCINDCFESKLVIEAVENEHTVYMYRDETKVYAKAPIAYRRKIEGYERDLKSYEIILDKYPTECKSFISSGNSNQAVIQKKRILTTVDLSGLQPGETLYVYQGDILTMLAREEAAAKGIEIIYC